MWTSGQRGQARGWVRSGWLWPGPVCVGALAIPAIGTPGSVTLWDREAWAGPQTGRHGDGRSIGFSVSTRLRGQVSGTRRGPAKQDTAQAARRQRPGGELARDQDMPLASNKGSGDTGKKSDTILLPE